MYQVKATKSERFTDTLKFQHKNITCPTITHSDKILAVIADCAKAIKNMGNNEGKEKMNRLHQLTQSAVQQTSTNILTADVQPVPRVQS